VTQSLLDLETQCGDTTVGPALPRLERRIPKNSKSSKTCCATSLLWNPIMTNFSHPKKLSWTGKNPLMVRQAHHERVF
jgi:hypothetical protein